MACSSELVYDEEDIADVYVDAALEIRLEHHVAAHGLPVSVECKADELATCVHDRASGVTSCDVIVAEERHRHLAVLQRVLSEILILPKLLELIRHHELPVVRIFLFHHSVKSGVMSVDHGVLRRISLDRTVSQSHREVCIRI